MEGASYIKDSAQQVRKMLLQMDGIARRAKHLCRQLAQEPQQGSAQHSRKLSVDTPH